MTIIFISHKLNEVKRISDRITVLKGVANQGNVFDEGCDGGRYFQPDGRPGNYL